MIQTFQGDSLRLQPAIGARGILYFRLRPIDEGWQIFGGWLLVF